MRLSRLGARGRTAAAVGLVVVGAVVVAVLQLRAEPDEDPLSPGSYESDGTRALVDTLTELGARVEISRDAPATAERVVVLRDDLDEAGRDRIEEAAEAGAAVLVTDPMSPLAPEVEPASLGASDLLRIDPTPDCPIDALDGVGTVRAHGPAFVPDDGAVGCFPVEGGPWLVVTPTGDGQVVSTGSAQWLTNAELARADNAALAAALLLPHDSASVVVVPPGEFVPTGDGIGVHAAFDLIPGAVWAGLAQLVVAVVALIAWRSRRLGRPVTEAHQVALPGSELVIAVGELLQATRSHAHAGARLRDDVRVEIGVRLGLGPDAETGEVLRAVVDAGVDEALATRALAGSAPTDDSALVALARDLEEVRDTLAHGSRVPG